MQKRIYLLFIILSSCIEPYKPDISKYENVFVVDGKLTNLPGPYTVKLSRSFEFDENVGQPVSGAQLKIIENTGKEVDLKESYQGVYVTIDKSFQGIVGNSYKLQIVLEGEKYESDFETLRSPVPIDSVYWIYRKLQNGKNAVQLLLNTHDPENLTRYYGWDFVETWKFDVPIAYPAMPSWRVCYRSATSSHFNVATTIHLNKDILEGRPLQLIDERTNRLYYRYSILVTQFSLTEKAYKYFDALVSLNQNQGSLFDPTPTSLFGNIKNLGKKDLPVLGYFLVSGASEKRIFIDKSELPRDFRPTSGFEDCVQEYVTVNWKLRNNLRLNKAVDSLMRYGYSIIIKEIEAPASRDRDTLIHLYLAKAPCYNCTLNGTNVVPDFWTEKRN